MIPVLKFSLTISRHEYIPNDGARVNKVADRHIINKSHIITPCRQHQAAVCRHPSMLLRQLALVARHQHSTKKFQGISSWCRGRRRWATQKTCIRIVTLSASLMDDPEEQDPFNNEADSTWGEHPLPQDDGMLPHHDAKQVDLMEAPPIGTQHSCCLLSYS
jgi:hypothetical protein